MRHIMQNRKLYTAFGAVLLLLLSGPVQPSMSTTENRTLPESPENDSSAVGAAPLLGPVQPSMSTTENRTLPESPENDSSAVGAAPLLAPVQPLDMSPEERLLPGLETEAEAQKCEECSTYIVNNNVSISPGNNGTSTSFCDTGDQLVESGYHIDLSSPEAARSLFLYSNGPAGNITLTTSGGITGQPPVPEVENQEGWRVGLVNTGSTTAKVFATILCANLTP